jgi:hypothetical protein
MQKPCELMYGVVQFARVTCVESVNGGMVVFFALTPSQQTSQHIHQCQHVRMVTGIEGEPLLGVVVFVPGGVKPFVTNVNGGVDQNRGGV